MTTPTPSCSCEAGYFCGVDELQFAEIDFCPLHEAAADMRDALERFADLDVIPKTDHPLYDEWRILRKDARYVLGKARSTTPTT